MIKMYNEEIEKDLESIKKGIIFQITSKLNDESLTTLDLKLLAEAYSELE